MKGNFPLLCLKGSHEIEGFKTEGVRQEVNCNLNPNLNEKGTYMLSITMTDEVKTKLHSLLKEEDDPNARVRIREFKTGAP